MALKPNESVIVAALTAIGVLLIFSHTTPNTADVKASAPGGQASVNTHGSIKTAAIEATALVVGVAVLARDPTVYVVGGAVTAFEAWKGFQANATDAKGNVVAPGANTSGQPTPTLNQGAAPAPAGS